MFAQVSIREAFTAAVKALNRPGLLSAEDKALLMLRWDNNTQNRPNAPHTVSSSGRRVGADSSCTPRTQDSVFVFDPLTPMVLQDHRVTSQEKGRGAGARHEGAAAHNAHRGEGVLCLFEFSNLN